MFEKLVIKIEFLLLNIVEGWDVNKDLIKLIMKKEVFIQKTSKDIEFLGSWSWQSKDFEVNVLSYIIGSME